jgi:predicted ArsR family transcriptional regulator
MAYSYAEMMKDFWDNQAKSAGAQQANSTRTERESIEAALKWNHTSDRRFHSWELDVLKSAARKHLDTLPEPVFKVTGYRQGKGRMTETYADPKRAAAEAACWLNDGMQHVAIFRDEV